MVRAKGTLLKSHLVNNPHKTFLVVVSFLGGVIGCFNPQAISGAIDYSFPDGFEYIWYAILAVVSLVALIGMAQWRYVYGLLLERIALIAQSFLLVAYAFALIAWQGAHGYGGSLLFYTGFAVANIVRAIILTAAFRDHLRIEKETRLEIEPQDD